MSPSTYVVASFRVDGENHFAAMQVQAMLDVVHARGGRALVELALRRAGVDRSWDEIREDSGWMSYATMRAILEAAGDDLGSLDDIAEANWGTYSPDWLIGSADMVQSFPKIEDLYRDVALVVEDVSPIVEAGSVEVAPHEWLLFNRFREGFEPYPEYCAMNLAQFFQSGRLFGLEDYWAEEESCQTRGDSMCVFRVTWGTVAVPTGRTNYLESRIRILEERIGELHGSVAGLVSNDDLNVLLTRTLESASRAVRAPGYILDVTDPSDLAQVLVSGLSRDYGETLARSARELESGQHGAWISVDVVSTRQRYGRLIAVRGASGFLPQEAQILQSYASMAAAALDSARALDLARRDAEAARGLLALASDLADLPDSADVASKVVRAIPAVTGCSRAVFGLFDAETGALRIAASLGFDPAVTRALDDALISLPRLPADLAFDGGDPTSILSPPDTYTSSALAMMALTGEADFVQTPVLRDGSWFGFIGAVIEPESDPLTRERVYERLIALAAQASTALNNASLLRLVRHRALHDSLTGLPNRALLLDRVDQMLARCRRSGTSAAVLFVDLDRFKEVNDTFGHAAGDEILQTVASRLVGVVRESDTVARFGGDEFVVLIESDSQENSPEAVAMRLAETFEQPFNIDLGRLSHLQITASIGIAVGDRASASELVRDADIALYAAKAQDKDSYVSFAPVMQASVQERLLMHMDLQTALARGEFHLEYQPTWNLATGKITGVEALLRWNHPRRGIVEPSVFIPIMEETGLILDVGRWVLNEGCRQVVSWRAQGFDLDLAVNVSGRQLHQECLLADVREALHTSGFDPRRLVVELTETVLIQDKRVADICLGDVRELGVRVAIDDFGTGYSSLAYLRQLPVDMLKIDRTFVSALGREADAEPLVHMLIQLGKTLGLETLAEGIEDLGQYEILRREECVSGQGYLLSRALLPENLLDLLRVTKGSFQRPLRVTATAVPTPAGRVAGPRCVPSI